VRCARTQDAGRCAGRLLISSWSLVRSSPSTGKCVSPRLQVWCADPKIGQSTPKLLALSAAVMKRLRQDHRCRHRVGAVIEEMHLRSEEHTSELQSRENLVCR